MARTLIHEILHAEFQLEIRTAGYQINNRDNAEIFEFYRLNIKEWSHELMAQRYIQWMADILQVFDGNGQSRQFYEDISWAGLDRTPTWNNVLTQAEKTRIIAAIVRLEESGNFPIPCL